jgi:hypothetical protein
MKTVQYYVGCLTNRYEVFRFVGVPEPGTLSQYTHVIGPFKSKRGAEFMRDHGRFNPHVRSVSDAERLARQMEANL